MTTPDDARRGALLRRGFALEYTTLGWNAAGIVVLGYAAVTARSVALAGFGLDSLIEIGASAVVVWELSGAGQDRQRRALRLIGIAFAALAAYLAVQSTWVLIAGFHPRHSPTGIAWTAITAVVMFGLAYGKAGTGRALGNPVLATEGRVTLIDGILAVAVLAGLVLNAAAGWWQADPAAGYVLVYYAVRECRQIFTGASGALAASPASACPVRSAENVSGYLDKEAQLGPLRQRRDRVAGRRGREAALRGDRDPLAVDPGTGLTDPAG